jgi:hypothetical protein
MTTTANNLLADAGNTKDDRRLSAAWAFILEHAEMVDSAAWKVVRGTPLEYDDGRGELIAYLVENHHKWNPSRGWSARTWVFAQASKVRRSMVRAAVRNKFAQQDDDYGDQGVAVGDDLLALQVRAAVAGERGAEPVSARLAIILRNTDERHRVAVVSVLQDWDAKQVRQHLGVTKTKRDEIVAELGV